MLDVSHYDLTKLLRICAAMVVMSIVCGQSNSKMFNNINGYSLFEESRFVKSVKIFFTCIEETSIYIVQSNVPHKGKSCFCGIVQTKATNKQRLILACL